MSSMDKVSILPAVDNVDAFIEDLCSTLKHIPKADKHYNLLTQLQKQRESDRPIAEIHHTLSILRQTLEWWQRYQQQELKTLLLAQKDITTRVMNLSIRNEQFNSKYISRLHEFHTRLVPSRDHHGLGIARKGMEKFLEQRDAKISGMVSQHDSTPKNTLTKPEAVKTAEKEALKKMSGPKTRKKKKCLLAKLSSYNADASNGPLNTDARAQRKRHRESVTQLSV